MFVNKKENYSVSVYPINEQYNQFYFIKLYNHK